MGRVFAWCSPAAMDDLRPAELAGMEALLTQLAEDRADG